MSTSLTQPDRESLEQVIQNLEKAWNTGNGAAFAAAFASDADFVNIRAEHARGREAIAAGHDAILRTIYAGSAVQYTVVGARLISPEVALVHVRATLDAPSGPMAGQHTALFSAVFVHSSTGWEIAAFHNTLTPPSPAR